MLDRPLELTRQFDVEALEAVHESDRDGLVYFTEDGTIEYVNRAAMELFETDDSIVGENIFALRDREFEPIPAEVIYPSDHFEKALAAYRRGRPARSELVVIGDDRREVEVIWGPVRREGEIVGVVGSYRDVTPRPSIHDQLAVQASEAEERRQLLASVLDQIDQGVLVFDDRLVIEVANPAALEQLGLDGPARGLTVDECTSRSALARPSQFEDQLREIVDSHSPTTELHRVDRAPGDATDDVSDPRNIRASTSPVPQSRERYLCTFAPRADSSGDEPPLSALVGGLPEEGDGSFQQVVDRIVDRSRIDFAILSRLEDGRFAPVAWQGVLLDDSRSVALGDCSEFAAAFEEGDPQRLDRWIWRDGRESGRVDQCVYPLAGGDERFGILHAGIRPDATRPSEPSAPLTPALVGRLEPVARHLAAVLAARNRNRQLLDARGQLDALVRGAPVGVMIFDRYGDVRTVNRRAVELTEYEDWSNLNTDSPPFEFCGPDGDPFAASEQPVFRAVDRGERIDEEVLLDFGDHRRRLDLTLLPLDGADDSPTCYASFLRRAGSDEEGRRGDALLEIAGHELRSPLTPLTGLIQLARRQRERGDAVDLSLLTRAERQVSRLTRLVEALEDATKLEQGDLELQRTEIDARAFVEECIAPWRANPKDIEIEFEPPADELAITGDPDRLHQVVTNLLDNAIKYSDAESTVVVSVEGREGEVRLTVEDEGIGMEDELLSRVFDRYASGTPARGDDQSNGLGLYISDRIVDQHGGGIEIESERGAGTCVSVTLPAAG